ncbi:hypothetical protein R3P38DRAFT_3176413 [Favolaschia claudopus]|uniref:Uncharacterized protein n=1 Tax=Favolaschia claudopus TaxID=2862362 RepID=A0AAW0D7Q3_9AGAR
MRFSLRRSLRGYTGGKWRSLPSETSEEWYNSKRREESIGSVLAFNYLCNLRKRRVNVLGCATSIKLGALVYKAWLQAVNHTDLTPLTRQPHPHASLVPCRDPSAKPYPFSQGRAGYNAIETLTLACPDQYSKAGEILQFSLGNESGADESGRNLEAKVKNVVPNQNGFVATLLDAYTKIERS